jgi:FG-GAP-like repeat/IPT/TIG domain
MQKVRTYLLEALRRGFILAIAASLSPHSLPAQASNPVPFISKPLVPTAVAPGGQGFTLTVNGAGFVPGSVVMWNGRPRPTIVINDTRLTAQIPASDTEVEGTAWVTVANPTPGGGESNVLFFSATEPTSRVSLVRKDLRVISGVGPAPGDFNNDRRLDFVLAPYDGSSFSVYLGKGDGTFGSPLETLIPVSQNAGFNLLLVGDFNGDGSADVVVGQGGDVYRSNPRLLTFLGKGNGEFEAPLPTSMPPGYFGPLAVADFNGDGKLDLVGAITNSYDSQSLAISLGNGDGAFQSPRTYSFPSPPPQAAAVGDFNGDGKLDVAVAATSEISVVPGSVYIFSGVGDGTFNAPRAYTVPPNPAWIVLGDLNGDGKPDLATANAESNTVSVLLGNGDGTFQAAANYDVPDPIAVILADFNGDGNLDISTTNGDSHSASILLGSGDGTFQAGSDYALPSGPSILVAGDFDGSGRQGLLVDLPNASTVSVLLQPPTYLTVSIDIKPGDATNTINLKSNGVVPVAILGSATFDPMTVDPSTVVLTAATDNGSGAPGSAHVAIRGRGALMTGQSDVNNDGYPDLLVYFRTQDLTALQQMDSRLRGNDGTSAETATHPPAVIPAQAGTQAVLYGTTYSGQRIRGSDTVRIVPAGKGSSAGAAAAGAAGHKPLPPPGARGSGVTGLGATGSAAGGNPANSSSSKTLPTGPRGGN